MEKSEFFELIREGSYKGFYKIIIDKGPPYWGPIVNREQAEEMWSRFKNSGQTFEEFVKEWL